MNEFKKMTDLFSYCKANPEKIVCPLCNAFMDTMFFPSFNLNYSGAAAFKCKNTNCDCEFKIAAIEAVV